MVFPNFFTTLFKFLEWILFVRTSPLDSTCFSIWVLLSLNSMGSKLSWISSPLTLKNTTELNFSFTVPVNDHLVFCMVCPSTSVHTHALFLRNINHPSGLGNTHNLLTHKYVSRIFQMNTYSNFLCISKRVFHRCFTLTFPREEQPLLGCSLKLVSFPLLWLKVTCSPSITQNPFVEKVSVIHGCFSNSQHRKHSAGFYT